MEINKVLYCSGETSAKGGRDSTRSASLFAVNSPDEAKVLRVC